MTKPSLHLLHCTWLGLALNMVSGYAASLPDGLYAVWNTNMGSITGELFYAEAPRTVANFVGLAEGTQTWVKEGTSELKNDPFFDGQIVNRVAQLTPDSNSWIVQTGSQNGTNGGGGPGYTFKDEISPTRRHDKMGVISMANSGTNSNAAQYFFCGGPLVHLDDVHTIFGQLVGGGNTLTNIVTAPMTNGKPTDDVAFTSVNILRVGTEAEAFDPAAHDLPVVEYVDLKLQGIYRTNTTEIAYGLAYNCPTNAFLNLWTGENLEALSDRGVKLIHRDPGVAPDSANTSTNTPHFASMFQVRHAENLYTPQETQGLRITDTADTFDIQFDPSGTSGTVEFNLGTLQGTISGFLYQADAYRATFAMIHSVGTLPPRLDLKLSFLSAETNSYSGELLDWNGVNWVLNQTLVGEFTYEHDSKP